MAGSEARARGAAVPAGRRPPGPRPLGRPSRRRRRARPPRSHHVPFGVRPSGQGARPRGGVVGLLLPPGDVRAAGEARVPLRGPPHPPRRPADRADRAGVRPEGARPARQRRVVAARREGGIARPSAARARALPRRRTGGAVRIVDAVLPAADPDGLRAWYEAGVGSGPSFARGETEPHHFAFHSSTLAPWRERLDVTEEHDFSAWDGARAIYFR